MKSLVAFTVLLFLLPAAPSVTSAQAPEEFLGPWELVATLDFLWPEGTEEYPEGHRQRIRLDASTLTVFLPDGGGTFSYDIEWNETGYTVTSLTSENYLWPAANPCQPTAVALFTGSSWYPFPIALPCVDAPCLRMVFTGCTDSPLYFFAPLEPGVSVDTVNLGTIKARY